MDINDLEIFIYTYNRKEMLNTMLNSLFNQTITGFKITVIDNCSTDDTVDFVNSLMLTHPKLRVYSNPYMDRKLSLQKVKDLASTKYMMALHDDDCLSPYYIETVLKILDKFDNIDLICSVGSCFYQESEILPVNFRTINFAVFKNQLEFTAHIYSSFFVNGNNSLWFPTVVYKSEYYKKQATTTKFGKAGDKPFVINAINNGICIQLREPLLFNYRLHSGQDSAQTNIDPNPQQIVEHHKFFKSILGREDWSKAFYDAFSLEWLDFLYNWGHNSQKSEDKIKFIELLVKNSLISKDIRKESYKKYIEQKKEQVKNLVLNEKSFILDLQMNEIYKSV